MDDTTSTSGSSPSSPSSHGEIVSALSSGAAALKASEPPTPTPAPTPPVQSTTSTAPPAVTPGSPDSALPPTAAAADPDADLSTPVVGPIPPDRHKKILERTREKVAQETKAAFEHEHGEWLTLKSQFTPREFQTLMPTLKTLASDPVRFMHDTAREMGMQLVPITQNGQNGVPRGTPPRGQAPADEPQPDIAVQLENGQIAHTYSAEQQAKRDQWFLSQLDGKLGQELKPFREYQQQQEYRAFLGGIDQQARQDFAEVAQNEAFEQLRPQIAAIMKSDKRYTLDKAYNRAYREHYLPTRDTKIRQQTLDEQTQKARAANSSLTPTRRTTAEQGAHAPATTAEILRQKAAELNVTL